MRLSLWKKVTLRIDFRSYDRASGVQSMFDWQDAVWKLLPVFTSFGVLIVGARLTRSAKRREWIADNQKEEYRRLLAALNRLNMAISEEHVQGTSSQDLQELMSRSIRSG